MIALDAGDFDQVGVVCVGNYVCSVCRRKPRASATAAPTYSGVRAADRSASCGRVGFGASCHCAVCPERTLSRTLAVDIVGGARRGGRRSRHPPSPSPPPGSANGLRLPPSVIGVSEHIPAPRGQTDRRSAHPSRPERRRMRSDRGQKTHHGRRPSDASLRGKEVRYRQCVDDRVQNRRSCAEVVAGDGVSDVVCSPSSRVSVSSATMPTRRNRAARRG